MMGAHIEGLTVSIADTPVVHGVDMSIGQGERVGLVGSSGSGKTMIAKTIMGLLPRQAVVEGSVHLGERQIVGASDEDMADIRGRLVSLVPQNPTTSLNPVERVGRQVARPLREHTDLGPDRRRDRVLRVLRSVGLDDSIATRYPHELSGGQCQRVCIATAMVASPRLIVADEPTTALDSLAQREILDLLTGLVEVSGSSLLLITHDFAVLSRSVSRAYVLEQGRVVEAAPIRDLIERPSSPMGRRLSAAASALTLHSPASGCVAVPSDDGVVNSSDDGGMVPSRGPVGSGCGGAASGCEACGDGAVRHGSRDNGSRDSGSRDSGSRGVRMEEGASVGSEPLVRMSRLAVSRGRGRHRRTILTDVDLSVLPGRTLAIIGSSGSGKTTMVRAMLGLEPDVDGDVSYRGLAVRGPDSPGFRALRRESALMSQNPFASLDPWWTVERSVGEPLRIAGWHDGEDIRRRVDWALSSVGLDASLVAGRYPVDLSGGQAQRVALARAMVTGPRLIVADEPMSALDVVSRMQVVEACESIRRARPDMAMVIVSHDLGVVRRMADDVVALRRGTIVERAPVGDIIASARSPYVRALVDAATM